MAPSIDSLSARLKSWAIEAGFDLAGIAPATPGLGAERLREWIAAGKHGEMTYMARHEDARRDPGRILTGAKSLLVVAINYRCDEPLPPEQGQGRISRYAWGQDYHHVLREKLKVVESRLRRLAPSVKTRIAVDSAPVMERDYARLAGLGWFGKNTLLLNKRLGSWFFLGAMLLDCELDHDRPEDSDHCGTCRKCLDACPTKAFDGPYQLDPRRCISYLTIEHKTDIPTSQASAMEGWIFGCDVCQDVCPWNQHAKRSPASGHAGFQPRPGSNPVDLLAVATITDAEFRERFGGTAIERTGRARLARNAMVAAENDT